MIGDAAADGAVDGMGKKSEGGLHEGVHRLGNRTLAIDVFG